MMMPPPATTSPLPFSMNHALYVPLRSRFRKNGFAERSIFLRRFSSVKPMSKNIWRRWRMTMGRSRGVPLRMWKEILLKSSPSSLKKDPGFPIEAFGNDTYKVIRKSLIAPSFNPHSFHIRKLADAVDAEFPAITGIFYAAEGQPRIGGDHAVNEN